MNRVRPPCAALLTMALGLASCLANREVARVATVPVGQWPEDVAFDPGSARLIVADEGSATVTVLRSDGQRVGTISLKTRARHLAVNPGLGHLYAPHELSGFVSAFHTLSLAETFRVAVGREPHGIAVDPVSHRVFVQEGDICSPVVVEITVCGGWVLLSACRPFTYLSVHMGKPPLRPQLVDSPTTPGRELGLVGKSGIGECRKQNADHESQKES